MNLVFKSIVEVRIDRDTLAKTIFIVNAYFITVSTLYIRLAPVLHCLLRYFVYISYLPPVSLSKIGKPYLNRTLVLKNLLLFFYQARASNYVKRCVAFKLKLDQGTVGEILSSLRKTTSQSFWNPPSRGFSFVSKYFCHNGSLWELVKVNQIGHYFVHSLSRNSVWNNAHFWWSFIVAFLWWKRR